MIRDWVTKLVRWILGTPAYSSGRPPHIPTSAKLPERYRGLGPTLADVRAGRASVPQWKPEHSLLSPEHREKRSDEEKSD